MERPRFLLVEVCFCGDQVFTLFNLLTILAPESVVRFSYERFHPLCLMINEDACIVRHCIMVGEPSECASLDVRFGLSDTL